MPAKEAPTEGRPLGCPRREDLERGGLLGEGAFARVLHVRDTRSSEEYALKEIQKRQIQAQGRKSSVMAEKAFLASLDHPGIIRLHFCFQDEWCLYFVLELVRGGELATQIKRMGTCPAHFTRFYVAEIVDVLVYLRAMRIAHRDLKPENMLLTDDGHLKVIDFDAAVVVSTEGDGDAAGGGGRPIQCQDQPEFAGTALYLPPEVLLSTARLSGAFALDLWALGCIIYQMLAGTTPFHASSEYYTFQRVLRRDYVFPGGFPDDARDLVDALLVAEPKARLGHGPAGLQEVKCHSFFGGSLTAFDQLRRQPPPPRMERRSQRKPAFEGRHGRGMPLLGEMASFGSFDDCISSAECTPEVGEHFVARKSTLLTIADLSDSNVTDATPATPALVGSQESCFLMSVQRPSKAAPPTAPPQQGRVAAPSRHQADLNSSGRHLHNHNAAAEAPALAKANSAAAKPTIQPPAAQAAPSSRPNWSVLAGLPFESGAQWMAELVRRHTLSCREDIVLAGRVVLRRLPCLRPKILLLTDAPRLLVLDSKGIGLVRDIDLACSRGGNPDNLLTVRTAFDFVLSDSAGVLRCFDINFGSKEWSVRISVAQQKLASVAGRSRAPA